MSVAVVDPVSIAAKSSHQEYPVDLDKDGFFNELFCIAMLSGCCLSIVVNKQQGFLQHTSCIKFLCHSLLIIVSWDVS